MRKKNLKVQVAALAVTGVIAATPLSVRADETGNPAAINTEAALSTATAAASATSQQLLHPQKAQQEPALLPQHLGQQKQVQRLLQV